MSKITSLRIGTRDSELAVWQATQVAEGLQARGYRTELVHVKTEGDIDLETPLSELGGKGVFTKALDVALINGEIDLAVHSHKDLPTVNPLPLEVAAVLERGDPRDSLVAPGGTDFLEGDAPAVVATGSNRRRAQWLNRYPHHQMADLRGNVNTRLEKIERHGWKGAIFAAAGLQRIGLEGRIASYLDWMVPAPAQAAMAVMVREDDDEVRQAVAVLDHKETALCTRLEREFLREMEAGCSAPVGAHARLEEGMVHFKAVALTLDGTTRYDIEKELSPDRTGGEGAAAARELLDRGADRIMDSLKS
ncbi:MAG: hydroxymethylbilane synthase [Balneolaceae bacterium]|nr:hydroxymethylbilane synthase [Balneolaceae bacterium]